MPTLAELLQRRAMPQGMLSSGPMVPVAPPMPTGAPIPFGAGRQQLTPQQLEMLMKALQPQSPFRSLDTTLPTEFKYIPASTPRG